MHPRTQCKSDVERMTAAAGMRVRFIAQPQCPIRIAQHPGANRGQETDLRLGILVEDVRKMPMGLGIVEVQHLVSVFNGFSEPARPTRADASKRVSRY